MPHKEAKAEFTERQIHPGGEFSSRNDSAPRDDEANHLIVRILAQTITRRRARHAALNETPRQEPSEDLR